VVASGVQRELNATDRHQRSFSSIWVITKRSQEQAANASPPWTVLIKLSTTWDWRIVLIAKRKLLTYSFRRIFLLAWIDWGNHYLLMGIMGMQVNRTFQMSLFFSKSLLPWCQVVSLKLTLIAHVEVTLIASWNLHKPLYTISLDTSASDLNLSKNTSLV